MNRSRKRKKVKALCVYGSPSSLMFYARKGSPTTRDVRVSAREVISY